MIPALTVKAAKAPPSISHAPCEAGLPAALGRDRRSGADHREISGLPMIRLLRLAPNGIAAVGLSAVEYRNTDRGIADMRQNSFGNLPSVSALTLGGGGL